MDLLIISLFFFVLSFVFGFLCLLFVLKSKNNPHTSVDLSLSVSDIDLITSLLNVKLNSIGNSEGLNSSFSSEYWSLMLKLKRIRLSLEDKDVS